MNLELLSSLFVGFIFYGMIYSFLYFLLNLVKWHYLKSLCKYGGTQEKPGRACVVCCYNHACERVNKNQEMKDYLHWRKIMPERAKRIYDEIWEEENKLRLQKQKNSLTPYPYTAQTQDEED